MIEVVLSKGELKNVRKDILRIIYSSGEGDRKHDIPEEVLLPYWFPLCKVNDDAKVIAFDWEFFFVDDRMERLRKVFAKRNIMEVYEIPELCTPVRLLNFSSEEYFAEDEEGDLFITMAECFWIDRNRDWMMYTSHEGTISFWGEWLVDGIKEEFKNYEKYEIK